jgi:hypothetical protein
MVVTQVPAPHLERLEQLPRHRRDLGHGAVEGRLIGLGGSVKPADLADELQRGVVEFGLAWRMIMMTQPFDVSAHDKVTSSYVEIVLAR